MIIKEVAQTNTKQLYLLAKFLETQLIDSAAKKSIATKTFNELANDITGSNFEFSQIKDLIGKDPLKNVIQGMSDDGETIYFKGAAEDTNKGMSVTRAQDVVSKAADRAAKKRNK